jgi:hypothetical protein
VTYTKDPTFNVIGNVSIGPEAFHDNSDYRFLLEVEPTYTPANSPWTFGADALWASEEHAALSGGTAYWYGVTGYVGYKVGTDGMFTPNLRVEWFRDDGGSRTGIDQSLYEVTLGCSIKPFPADPYGANLTIRPEARYDHSSRDAFDNGRHHDQITLALDAIFTF